MLASYVTQLWASVEDLGRLGPPLEALVSQPVANKEAALRAASGLVASYARSRYRPPLAMVLEEVDDSALAPGSLVVTGTPIEAISLGIKVLDDGAVGTAVPIAWDIDGNGSFAHETTLATSGVFEHRGLILTFAGTLVEDAIVVVRAGCDWALREQTVSVAAHSLVYNRGVDGDSEDGKALAERRALAVSWAKDLQSEKAKLDERSDATPGRRETRPRGGGQRNAWDFLDEDNCYRPRRRWPY